MLKKTLRTRVARLRPLSPSSSAGVSMNGPSLVGPESVVRGDQLSVMSDQLSVSCRAGRGKRRSLRSALYSSRPVRSPMNARSSLTLRATGHGLLATHQPFIILQRHRYQAMERKGMTPQAAYDELIRRVREQATLGACIALLEWDELTYMPPGGVAGRAQQLAYLAGL